MRTVTVKNIPNDLYEKIKETAHGNRRSINNEIIHRLDRSLRSQVIDAEALLSRIERLRHDVSVPLLTDEMIAAAKEDGRP
ncbi:Arc family DNA-binding protein [bacterium]|nr:Arc family DNA-binding protein [bacterium]